MAWMELLKIVMYFKRRVKSHLSFADIIRAHPIFHIGRVRVNEEILSIYSM
jgi:hypothetical protein